MGTKEIITQNSSQKYKYMFITFLNIKIIQNTILEAKIKTWILESLKLHREH